MRACQRSVVCQRHYPRVMTRRRKEAGLRSLLKMTPLLIERERQRWGQSQTKWAHLIRFWIYGSCRYSSVKPQNREGLRVRCRSGDIPPVGACGFEDITASPGAEDAGFISSAFSPKNDGSVIDNHGERRSHKRRKTCSSQANLPTNYS